MSDILVDVNGDEIFDKDDVAGGLPNITDESGDGKFDVNLTQAESSAIIGGAIFQDAANVGSGTGNYNTILALQDDNEDDATIGNDSDGVETGFNAGQSGGGAQANPEDDSNDEMDASKSEVILLGAIPIKIVDGIAYYEFRVDLNEANSGADTLISLDQFKLYVGPYDLDGDPPNPIPSTSGQNDPNVDLVDTVSELQTLDLVYDMDAGRDVSVLMDEANSSGSGNDDYVVLVPVANFAGLDPVTTYVYLYVQMGAAGGDGDGDGAIGDKPSQNNVGDSQVWVVNGGFHEWNLQNAVIITGTKFNDINGDGTQDAGEGGVEGVTIYIDDDLDGIVEATDNNGVLDVGEQSDITDANGAYSFGGIPVYDNNYTIYIREIVPAGSEPTTPLPVAVEIGSSLAAGSIIDPGDVPGLLIGNHELTPSVAIDKSADVDGDCADVVGELITYTITVDNDGQLDLTNVVVQDDFEGAGNVTLTVTGDTNLNTILDVGEVWLSGDDGDSILQTDETWTYSYVRAVTQEMIDGNGVDGTLDNTATVNADSATDSVNDSDDASVDVCQYPTLDIDKVADVDGDCADVVGELITYTVTLDNIGNVALENVVLEDDFEGAGNVTLTVTGDTNLNTILDVGEVWLSGDTDDDGIMGVDETWTYSYVRAVTQEMIDSNGVDGTLDNTATANADAVTSGAAADEVSDDASVDVCQYPTLDIVKDADVDGDCADVVGELITYTVTLDNIGNVALENVVLKDDFEGAGNVTLTVTGDTNLNTILDVGEVWLSGDTGDDGIMGVDETWTYSYVRAVTQEMIDSNGVDGTLDNTATANADGVTSGAAADEVSDDASVDVCQNESITLVKNVRTDTTAGLYVAADNPTGPIASTGTADFQVIVTNNGNVSLENVTLTDTVDHNAVETDEVIDYNLIGAEIDIDNDGIIDGLWSDYDEDQDGTLDDADGNFATVDDFILAPGASFAVYYSLDPVLGQHENTAVVTADAATTGSDVTAEDDANYYVVESEDCVGVRTPGFWANSKWGQFWNLNANNPGSTATDQDSLQQAGQPSFPGGELLYAIDTNEDGFVNAIAGDGINDAKPLDANASGLLIGDYNKNGITDDGEDTIFISLADAKALINASNKNISDGKTADGIWMLGRDVVATWLNYLSNNPDDTEGECIGGVSSGDGTNTPREYLDASIDWLQQFASDQNSGNANTNLNTSFHDGDTQAKFQFDGRIAPSSGAWQNPFTAGNEDIPVSAAAMHAALDGYNNTGKIGGIEYCCDADSQLVVSVLSQIDLI